MATAWVRDRLQGKRKARYKARARERVEGNERRLARAEAEYAGGKYARGFQAGGLAGAYRAGGRLGGDRDDSSTVTAGTNYSNSTLRPAPQTPSPGEGLRPSMAVPLWEVPIMGV